MSPRDPKEANEAGLESVNCDPRTDVIHVASGLSQQGWDQQL